MTTEARKTMSTTAPSLSLIFPVDSAVPVRVYTTEGRGRGPNYGEVWYDPTSDCHRPYLAGRINAACRGVGILDERRYSTLAAAKRWADRHTDI